MCDDTYVESPNSLELELESGKVVEKGVPLQSEDKDISSESESELGKVVGKGVPLHK